MRRAPRAPDRVSLGLPASAASVALVENAARRLLQHRGGAAATTARLASASAELLDAGLARARPQDRFRVHYDVKQTEVTVTVELRRRGRRRPATALRRSVTVP